MNNQTQFVQPPVALLITTYELVEDTPGSYRWTATVTHTFHGDSKERVYQIMEAHKKTDIFFSASFQGNYKGIILKNSEPQII